MKNLFVLLTAIFVFTAPAFAGWAVYGVIQGHPDSTIIADSTRFMIPGGQEITYPTPGWQTAPNALDTFVFPDLPDWPELIMTFAWIGSLPVIQPIMQPVSDSWYPFQPPFEDAKIMFHGTLGIEEAPNPIGANSALSLPGILTNQALKNLARNNQMEILNPCGQVVRYFPLSPGVYFCRLIDKPNATQRFTLIR
ncbi:MAG: hypothetical protein ABIK49_03795 [candidate division WOR-3 bacterium]